MSSSKNSLPVKGLCSMVSIRVYRLDMVWGSGPETNTCRKVPYQVNFFR